MARKALLIGGTGLIGRLVADRLLAEGAEVHAMLRHAANRTAPNWHEHLASPGAWPALVRRIGGETAISALGTTWRAVGSEAAFRAVDLDMVVDFAAAARAAGFHQMIAVSSVGADAQARAFYLRVKGEMEAALRALAFERLDIVRPGLLRGERGPERRRGERVGILLSPLVNLFLRGRLDLYAAIDAGIVARAILGLAGAPAPGTYIHHNRDLHRLARNASS
jgi:uncharacterized protein YbjT (DUF2867 family)